MTPKEHKGPKAASSFASQFPGLRCTVALSSDNVEASYSSAPRPLQIQEGGRVEGRKEMSPAEQTIALAH